jgi:hypothetical protein
MIIYHGQFLYIVPNATLDGQCAQFAVQLGSDYIYLMTLCYTITGKGTIRVSKSCTSTDIQFPHVHVEESHELFHHISCHGMESDIDIPATMHSLESDIDIHATSHSLTCIPLYSYGIIGPVIFSIF